MARHSKWHNIKHKKAAEDSRKGKVFTKHAKLIAIAARAGADPGSNPLLKAAIEVARAENLPNENIERAIKKGSGEGKDAVNYEENIYEGFGPGGVAMLISTLTDNKNRALGNIKVIMNKKGGRLAESGAVAWMFKKVGVIFLEIEGKNQNRMEEIVLELIDLGAQDVETDGNMMKVITAPEDLGKIRNAIIAKGWPVDSSELTYEAANKTEMAENDPNREALEILIEALEAEDDVSDVFINLD
jgi:YebC/PmpR family DNA-binding regulatory protein